jgi:hypothetical protein
MTLKKEKVRKGVKDTSPHVGGKTKKAERDPSIFYAGKSKRPYKQQQVIDALVAADGAITIAAKRLGTSYRHLKKYIDASDKLTEVLHGIEEINLDAAESTLFAAIKEGNLTATIFYLKTKGKGRGYTEHDKQDISKLPPVTIVYHSPRDPARLAAQQKQIEAKTIDITSTDAAIPAAVTRQTTELEP